MPSGSSTTRTQRFYVTKDTGSINFPPRAAAKDVATAAASEPEGERRCTTCVVVRWALVDGGHPVRVDDPLGSSAVLRGPAAEGRVVEVAGEPDVR